MKESQMLDKDFKEIFENVKSEILNAQYDIYKNANVRILALYNYLGKFRSITNRRRFKFTH